MTLDEKAEALYNVSLVEFFNDSPDRVFGVHQQRVGDTNRTRQVNAQITVGQLKGRMLYYAKMYPGLTGALTFTEEQAKIFDTMTLRECNLVWGKILQKKRAANTTEYH